MHISKRTRMSIFSCFSQEMRVVQKHVNLMLMGASFTATECHPRTGSTFNNVVPDQKIFSPHHMGRPDPPLIAF